MDKLALEQRLENVKELKRNNYIGTGQSLGYLKDVDYALAYPQKIADKINEKLDNGSLFLATSQRLLGIASFFEDIFLMEKSIDKLLDIKIDNSTYVEENFRQEDRGKIKNLSTLLTIKPNDIATLAMENNCYFKSIDSHNFRSLLFFEREKFEKETELPFQLPFRGIDDFIEAYTDLFKEANKEELLLESNFREFFSDYVDRTLAAKTMTFLYLFKGKQKGSNIKAIVNGIYRFKIKLQETISRTNWDYLFSEGFYKKSIEDEKVHIAMSRINLLDIAKKIRSDKIEHLTSHRIQLVDRMLEFIKPRNYNDLTRYYEERIRREMLIHGVQETSRYRVEELENYRLLRRVIAQERHYIEKKLDKLKHNPKALYPKAL